MREGYVRIFVSLLNLGMKGCSNWTDMRVRLVTGKIPLKYVGLGKRAGIRLCVAPSGQSGCRIHAT